MKPTDAGTTTVHLALRDPGLRAEIEAELPMARPDVRFERPSRADVLITDRPPPGVAHFRKVVVVSPDRTEGFDWVDARPEVEEASIAEHALMQALRCHRRATDYALAQAEGAWRPLPQKATAERIVGVLGLGPIGLLTAEILRAVGFRVSVWSRSSKAVDFADCHWGDEGLGSFLASTEILICCLRLAPETVGLLDRSRLSSLPRGASVVNVARGAIIRTGDLVELLDEGHLEAAYLDVFDDEPLGPGSPLWSHPRVTVTPHVAATSISLRLAASL